MSKLEESQVVTNNAVIKWKTQEEIDREKSKPIPLTDTEILGQQMTERELEAMEQGQQITDMEIRLMFVEMGASK